MKKRLKAVKTMNLSLLPILNLAANIKHSVNTQTTQTEKWIDGNRQIKPTTTIKVISSEKAVKNIDKCLQNLGFAEERERENPNV